MPFGGHFEAFWDLWAIFGAWVRPEKFFWAYSLGLITFILLDFLFSDFFDFCLFGVILRLLGTYWAIFRARVGSHLGILGLM